VYLKLSPTRLCIEGHEARISVALKDEFSMAKFPRPDFLFLACSPAFTPKSADALIPVIREYIKEF